MVPITFTLDSNKNHVQNVFIYTFLINDGRKQVVFREAVTFNFNLYINVKYLTLFSDRYK